MLHSSIIISGRCLGRRNEGDWGS